MNPYCAEVAGISETDISKLWAMYLELDTLWTQTLLIDRKHVAVQKSEWYDPETKFKLAFMVLLYLCEALFEFALCKVQN